MNHVVHRYRVQYLELRRTKMMGGGPEYPILGYYQIFYLWNLSPGRTKCCLLSRPKWFLHYIAY